MAGDPSKIDGGPRCVLVVGSAYVVQGLVAAVGMLLIMRLAQVGVSLEDQGWVLASGAVPWVLKFGIALLLDLGPRWSLRLRGLALMLLQLGAAAGVWAIAQAFVGGEAGAPSSVFAVAVGWFALNLCAATQDVIVDALALDTLADRRAATATAMGVGLALGFNVLGLWLIGGRIVREGMVAGLTWPVGAIGVLALVPALALLTRADQVRPEPRSMPAAGRPRWSWRELGRLLWIPPLFAALTLAANLTGAVAYEFLFVHLAWDYARYVTWVVPAGSVAALIGALACGPLIAKLGPARAAMITSIGLGVVWLSFALAAPWWSRTGTLVANSIGEGALQSAMMVALHGLALVVAARTPLPTTAFVLAMASLNLSRVLAPLLAPTLMLLGWAGLFAACGLAQILVSGGILPLSSYTPERRSDS